MKSLVLAFLALVLLAGIGTAAYAGHKECICEGDKCDEDCKNCDKCERCIHRKDCECGEVCVDDCKGCDKCGECLKKKRLNLKTKLKIYWRCLQRRGASVREDRHAGNTPTNVTGQTRHTVKMYCGLVILFCW